MSAHVSERILDLEDALTLRAEGTLVLQPVEGRVITRIHKRRLNRSSEEEYSDLPLPSKNNNGPMAPPSTAGGVLSPNRPLSPDHFSNIPDFLISREALLYVGFDEAAADLIWDRWTNWGSDNGREIDGGPVGFQSLVTAHIRGSGHDAFTDNDSQWHATMDACGINHSLRTAIMDPIYTEIRQTESCKYWLRDTVLSRFATLGEIQEMSRERVRAAQRAASRPSSSSEPPRQQLLSPRQTSAMLANQPGMSSTPAWSSIVRARSPEHTVLYKGGSKARFGPIFDEQGTLQEFGPLSSSPPGDFNSRGSSWCFATEHEVAHQYAVWAKKRDLDGVGVVLRIEIPNSAIESLQAPQKLLVHWPSTEWNELVWTCRRGSRLRGDLVKYARAALIIGTICGKPTRIVAELDTPSAITHDMVMRSGYISTADAVQFVFQNEEGEDFLEQHAKSNAKLYPVRSSHLDRFEDEALGRMGEKVL